MNVMERLQKQVDENPVVIYMKGTPTFPQCGFSMRTSQALAACGEEFLAVNIFEDAEVYQSLKQFSNWPTFPQVYIGGQFVGGCDITLDLFERGELQQMVKDAVAAGKQAGE